MKKQWLLVALLLSACGGGEEAETPPGEGVFDDMTGTIDKAKEVEQKVMDQKDRLDKALEEAERPEHEPER